MSHDMRAWAHEGVSVYTCEFNSSPKTQNDYKNVWICPALCNHKGMSWDISVFPLQEPSFPTARPGLENLFPLPLFLPFLRLFVETHEFHERAAFTAEPQCKFSVFKGAKGELRFLSGGKISTLRSRVISNQTDLWKQTQARSRVEWTLQVQFVLRNFLFSDTFITNERLFSSFGAKKKKKKSMMINHRQNAAQELCSGVCVFSCFLAASVWCLS